MQQEMGEEMGESMLGDEEGGDEDGHDEEVGSSVCEAEHGVDGHGKISGCFCFLAWNM
jgi:hypothetical protein